MHGATAVTPTGATVSPRTAARWSAGGPHVAPPAHFVAGAHTPDRVPVEEMFLPLVLLGIAARVERAPDSTPALGDVASREQRNGLSRPVRSSPCAPAAADASQTR
ncbi:cyclase family protein [Streptomyces sp. NPDC058457]|uniref:cyclase family protein n=1 Tax=Streptomyces sp. NPDC058457 TaxID=3346507 RepID=UPI0036639EFF